MNNQYKIETQKHKKFPFKPGVIAGLVLASVWGFYYLTQKKQGTELNLKNNHENAGASMEKYLVQPDKDLGSTNRRRGNYDGVSLMMYLSYY